uniref:Uncharacterized protein n=1 Tax=Acrobeloides nanus TaxID=290746 RepID=A0A914EI73_9BILA
MKSMLILAVSLLVIFVEKGEFSNLRCLPNILFSIDGTLDITGDISAKGSLLLNGDFARNLSNVNQGLLELSGLILVNTSNSPGALNLAGTIDFSSNSGDLAVSIDGTLTIPYLSLSDLSLQYFNGPVTLSGTLYTDGTIQLSGPADLTQTVLLTNNGVKHEQLTINGVVPGYALVGQLC